MNSKLTIRVMICLLMVLKVFAADETLKPPDKENKGIMATIAMVYQTTRNAVKFAYNEIQYAYELRDNVRALGSWFEKTKSTATNFYDYSSKIWNDPQNIIVTMKRMENVFDGAENLVFSTAYEFDAALSNIENAWDKAAGPVLFPQTDEILKYTEGMMLSTQKKNDEVMKQNENDPEVKLLQLSIVLASDAIAQSRAYSNWTKKELRNVKKIENEFNNANDETVLSEDMQALWYSIENTNTQSKLLQHQTNELVISTGLLGLKTYQLSRKKAVEKANINAINKFSLSFENSPYRNDMIAKSDKEKWEKGY